MRLVIRESISAKMTFKQRSGGREGEKGAFYGGSAFLAEKQKENVGANVLRSVCLECSRKN